MRTLLLVGSTGLVGQSVLQQALDHPAVGQVVAPTRRPLPAHPRLLNPVVDFEALPDDAWSDGVATCCTSAATGSATASLSIAVGPVLACSGSAATRRGTRTRPSVGRCC